jgi:tetrahydromethanopterin S-methyltransferase subunit G
MTNSEKIPDQCLHHAGLIKSYEEHERRLNAQDVIVQQIFEKIAQLSEKMVEKVEEITTRLLQRPGWAVTTIITLLTTLLGVAITIIVFLAKNNLKP